MNKLWFISFIAWAVVFVIDIAFGRSLEIIVRAFVIALLSLNLAVREERHNDS